MEKKTRDNNIIPFPKKYTDPYKELHEREELIRSYNNRNKRERREPTDVDIRRKNRKIKEERRKLKNTFIKRTTATVALGLGITAATVAGAGNFLNGSISNLKALANEPQNKDVKYAIAMANETESKLFNSLEFDEQQMMNIENLKKAIRQYNIFENNEDYKNENLDEYKRVCEEILDNKDFISKKYMQMIKEKIANVYELSDSSSINIVDTPDDEAGGYRIWFNNESEKVGIDTKFHGFNEKIMDNNLRHAVEVAIITENIDKTLDLKNLENVEEVIGAYGSMSKFADAKLSLDKDNNIVVSYEKDKSAPVEEQEER